MIRLPVEFPAAVALVSLMNIFYGKTLSRGVENEILTK
jgi:hypothetical protein